MYKKSPGYSPLREKIKSRCQNRMRADGEKFINGLGTLIWIREEKTFVENTIRMFVKVLKLSIFIHNFYILLF